MEVYQISAGGKAPVERRTSSGWMRISGAHLCGVARSKLLSDSPTTRYAQSLTLLPCLTLSSRLDLGFTALQTAVRFLPLGVTAFLVNMIVPHLLGPIVSQRLLVVAWVLGVVGVLLLSFTESRSDYWRFCFPGMVIYIAGVGTVYFVSMVSVIGAAPTEHQGSVAGVFNVSVHQYYCVTIPNIWPFI